MYNWLSIPGVKYYVGDSVGFTAREPVATQVVGEKTTLKQRMDL